MLQKQWSVVGPIVGAQWPQGKGGEAQAAIAQAIEAYKTYKYERNHVEARLIGMARQLGSIAMPPQSRPEAASLPLRQRAAKDILQDIVNGAEHSLNARQRSELVVRFMELAASQRREDDDELFGVLHISEPLPQSSIRYFSLRFRTPDGQEWALLESLRPEVATQVVPMEVARAYSSLQDFVADFNKKEQHTLGTRQVIHATGWNADTHMARIMAKLATPEAGAQ